MTRYPIAAGVFHALSQQSLTVVDAGASGAGEANRWGFLGTQLELHGFEADPEECAKLASETPPGVRTRYHNSFLGRPQASRTFYIAREFNNSFYPTDYEWYHRRRSSWLGQPIRQSEAFAIVKTIEVESVCLDDWAARADVKKVDYLKVDIEGAELELMQHSPRIMAGVLGVSVDVTFHADWIGAPTFADVDVWLRSQGFHLFDINGLKRGSQFDTPIVAPRGHGLIAGQVACANGIYFRDPLAPGAASMPATEMLKLAAIAEVHGQVEFAFELLRAAARLGDPGIPSERLKQIEAVAVAGYNAMLAGSGRAKWRNRLAAAARVVVPPPLRKAVRRISEKLGLGVNPLYPS